MPNKKIKNDKLYDAAFKDGKISVLYYFNSGDILNALQERIGVCIKETLDIINYEKNYIKTIQKNNYKTKKEYEEEKKFYINIIKESKQNFIKKLQIVQDATYF